MTETHRKQINKTVRHTAIYAIGTVIRRITGLVMLPIYTRYLNPADYGAVELLTMTIEVAAILIGLRISQAMFRYYILAESEEEKRTIVSTVFMTMVATSCVGAGILFAASGQLTTVIFGDLEYLYEFRLFTLTLVANAVASVGLSYLRARQMPVLFVSIGIAMLALQVALNILFVVILEMHVTGVVYSALISGFIMAAGLSIFLFANVGFSYSKGLILKLAKFVAPLILASLGAFYVSYADKYFLRLFSGLADVGLYALAARVSAVLATAYEAFNMSWGADRFEIVKRVDARVIYEQVFRYMSAVILAAGAGLALFANDFLFVMTIPEFYPAGNIVPLLVVATIFRVVTIYCNFGALYREQTVIMAQASWLKAGFATIGYVVLIPELGVYGAAGTLLLSNLLEFLWVHWKSSKLYDMGLRWLPVLSLLTVAMACVTVGMFMPFGTADYFAARVVLFLLMLMVMYLLPVWSREEREDIQTVFSKCIRKNKR